MVSDVKYEYFARQSFLKHKLETDFFSDKIAAEIFENFNRVSKASSASRQLNLESSVTIEIPSCHVTFEESLKTSNSAF